jgi:hypothetical protein
VVCVGASVLTLAGCQGLRQSIRPNQERDAEAQVLKREKGEPKSTEVAPVESDPSKIFPVDADTKGTQSFFKKNRRPGTWSSEAREIESHLGVQ